jgi:hypothetical protein
MIKYLEISCDGHLKKMSSNKVRYLIKYMYTNILTYVRACDGESNAFPIKIALH